MTLGARIKQLRIEKKLTQDDMGRELGMGRSNVGHIENGRTIPTSETLDKIADILGTTTDYLLGRTDDLKQEENMAFYGGGSDWTEEELEVARIAIEAYRRGKKNNK